jgi:hypothetical protein
MNPYYRSAIVFATLGGLAVKAYDDGETSSPPANVVGQMLAATTSSTTATIVVANTITGAIYDTWFGRNIAGDAPSRSESVHVDPTVGPKGRA